MISRSALGGLSSLTERRRFDLRASPLSKLALRLELWLELAESDDRVDIFDRRNVPHKRTSNLAPAQSYVQILLLAKCNVASGGIKVLSMA